MRGSPTRGRSDQVVDRHPVNVGEREEKLQARAALPVLQPGQRALRKTGPQRRLGQRQTALLADPSQPWTDHIECRSDRSGPDAPRFHRAGRSVTPAPRHSVYWTVRFPGTATDIVVAPSGSDAPWRERLRRSGHRRGCRRPVRRTCPDPRPTLVAVVDAGQPRNAPAAHMQGFLGSDGLPPDGAACRGPR